MTSYSPQDKSALETCKFFGSFDKTRSGETVKDLKITIHIVSRQHKMTNGLLQGLLPIVGIGCNLRYENNIVFLFHNNE